MNQTSVHTTSIGKPRVGLELSKPKAYVHQAGPSQRQLSRNLCRPSGTIKLPSAYLSKKALTALIWHKVAEAAGRDITGTGVRNMAPCSTKTILMSPGKNIFRKSAEIRK